MSRPPLSIVAGGRPKLSQDFQASRPAAQSGVARRLELARELSGLSVNEACLRLACGSTFLRAVERGDIGATYVELEKLSLLYKATVDWILGQVPEMVPESQLPKGGGRASPRDKAQLRTILAMRQVTGSPALQRLKKFNQPKPPDITA